MITQPLIFKPVGSVLEAESATCADSATFALQVLDDSMQPEFDQGCIVVLDPSAVIKEDAFVLANIGSANADSEDAEYVLRQVIDINGSTLSLKALNSNHKYINIEVQRQQIAGVVVQRAGAKRNYAKHYR